ncbi:hypothetical protein [Actinophytocola sp.]|uniref:hypothetical protein n=1 Tax=Actinophytocola sp. TaxID=1872138 RepID=UPI002D7ED2AE|nr:hypothetical protein [Actinophytocola sp.]HET9143341.1 hypothetical protein [Actinophytocola sp.]
MVPTLVGRIQTRLFLLAVVGGIVTALITPLLPADLPMAQRYQATYIVLAAVAVLGVGWELLYHLLQQWRWEKDWPMLFGLVTLVPEGLLVWALASRDLLPGLPGPVPTPAFVIHFVVVWLIVWLVANGPMRVPFIHWRFQGGQLT